MAQIITASGTDL